MTALRDIGDFILAHAALVIAGYAAILSTITGIVQLFGYRRDRATIRIAVGRNMQIIGHPKYSGKSLTIVNVMNMGRRPVTIASVGGWRLHPHNPFIIPDTNPELPCELTEGKNVRAILPPCDLDLATVDYWEACDAVANSYKLRVASWYAHLRSQWRWNRQWRNDRKSKGASASAIRK